MSVSMNVKVSPYTSRVLGVIKEKFGLKDKAEALDKFADLYGEEFIEKEVKDEVVIAMIKETEEWERKYKFRRKMSAKELDRLCGVNV